MPKNTTHTAALAVLFALALTGCAGSDEPPASDSERPLVMETASPEATSPSPLTAVEEPVFSDLDEAFLFEIKKRSDVATIANATDAQLLEAGHTACEALALDPDVANLRLVENETPRDDGRYFESQVIGTHATMVLCPEFAGD